MMTKPKWRSWPKVSPARSGAANTKRYTDEREEGTVALGDCWWCGHPADRLCDTMLLRRLPNGDLDKCFRVDGPTCDAHICEGCTSACVVYFGSECGTFDKRGTPLGRTETDSIDLCPYCQEHAGFRRGAHRLDTWNEAHYVSADLWRERVRAHAETHKREK